LLKLKNLRISLNGRRNEDEISSLRLQRQLAENLGGALRRKILEFTVNIKMKND
jgi:hypothetical protein